MKGLLAVAALAGAAFAAPAPQASSAACASSRAGTFGISVVNVTRKRDVLESRQIGNGQYTLQDGIFKDSVGRIGSIVANRQFQFDGPPAQAGAIYSSGWSICANGSIAVAGNAVFYQCLSGSFFNLYDRTQGGQCTPVYIVASGAAPAGPSGTVSQVADGQPQATTARVSQISDGQVQATTGRPVSQIGDGQVQATTGRPVSQIADGQVQASTGRPASQIADGQVQAPTGRPASQISDGQVQAPTGRPASQISDGQVQAPTGRPVSQISDGQVQAPTSRPVSQISDGQVQAPTSARPAIATFTGAAHREMAGSFAFVAGIVGAVAML